MEGCGKLRLDTGEGLAGRPLLPVLLLHCPSRVFRARSGALPGPSRLIARFAGSLPPTQVSYHR